MVGCEWSDILFSLTSRDESTPRLIYATLVVDFYNQINLLYGSITEFCSPQSCPEMKATDEYVVRSSSCRRVVLM